MRSFADCRAESLFAEIVSKESDLVTWSSLSRFLEEFKVVYLPEDLVFVFAEFGCSEQQAINHEHFADYFNSIFWKI